MSEPQIGVPVDKLAFDGADIELQAAMYEDGGVIFWLLVEDDAGSGCAGACCAAHDQLDPDAPTDGCSYEAREGAE